MQQISKAKTIKIFLFVFLLFATGTTNAQVGIGIPNPNPSAQLDVNSTNKGFLPPRMTQAQRNAIPSPAAGLTIWCKDCGILGEMQVYNGATWTNMTGASPAMLLPANVKIGSQVWMTKNLDVVTYRNGDTIPEVKDPAEWAKLTTGAWCYYNNDPANGAIYGKLYNHAAVVDPRGLAPLGWRIPNDAYYIHNSSPFFFEGGDWRALLEYLDVSVGIFDYSSAVAGDKMRASTLWTTPNTTITNESGFTGLPGGHRDKDGSFNFMGISGQWWSSGYYTNSFSAEGGAVYGASDYYVTSLLSAGSFDTHAFILFHNMFHDYTTDIDTLYPAGYGFSVRCVREGVTIVNQQWMEKNLDVTTYRNGDPIPEVENPAIWDTLTKGAWCYYGGNSTNGAIYGKLYNGYAVRDPRGLAPAGWHVPSDDEWNLLTSQLGGAGVAGNALKEKGTAHWNSPNAGATNSSGFTALPGGKREKGTFKQIGAVGSWWTSTPNSAGYLWYREVNYYDPNIYRWSIGERNAFSVRCVGD